MAKEELLSAVLLISVQFHMQSRERGNVRKKGRKILHSQGTSGYLLMTSKEGELSRICPMLLFSKSESAPVNALQEQKASS